MNECIYRHIALLYSFESYGIDVKGSGRGLAKCALSVLLGGLRVPVTNELQ